MSYQIGLAREHRMSELLERKRTLDDAERNWYRRARTSSEWWAKVEDNLERIEDFLRRDWSRPEGVLFHKEVRRLVGYGEVLEWQAGRESRVGELPPRRGGEADIEIVDGWIPVNSGTFPVRNALWRDNLSRCAAKLSKLKAEWQSVKNKRDAVAAMLRRVREIMRTQPPIVGLSPPTWEWRTKAGAWVGYIVKDV